MKLFQLHSSVYAAGKKLASGCSGRRRGRPNACRGRPSAACDCRDHPRRRHDFDHGQVVGIRPEAALRPPFPTREATGHDPAVLEPYAVQRLRHSLGDVVVAAGPYENHTTHEGQKRSPPCSSKLKLESRKQSEWRYGWGAPTSP